MEKSWNETGSVENVRRSSPNGAEKQRQRRATCGQRRSACLMHNTKACLSADRNHPVGREGGRNVIGKGHYTRRTLGREAERTQPQTDLKLQLSSLK